MKRGEFVNYLNDIGFSDKVKPLSPYKAIKLEFEEPLQVTEFEEALGLFSSEYSMWVDFGNGDIKKLDEVSENTSKLIFEYLESGNWYFQ